jgi:hypothetical protein
MSLWTVLGLPKSSFAMHKFQPGFMVDELTEMSARLGQLYHLYAM